MVRYLLADLDKLGLWPQLKNDLIAANGSVQNLPVPQEIKDLYKTTWEIKQKVLIDMAAGKRLLQVAQRRSTVPDYISIADRLILRVQIAAHSSTSRSR